MLFLRYESLRSYIRLYPVTSLILLANLILFLLMTVKGSSTDVGTLIRFGAFVNDYPLYEGQYWRYVSAVFLHSGVDHILFNCFAIFVFAPPLERILGHFRYLLFYIGAGVIGNIFTEWLYSTPHPSVGASGAIYGIYGAFVYMGLFRKRMLDAQSYKTIVSILAVGIIYSLLIPQVNLYAHIGGFIGGVALFALFSTKRFV